MPLAPALRQIDRKALLTAVENDKRLPLPHIIARREPHRHHAPCRLGIEICRGDSARRAHGLDLQLLGQHDGIVRHHGNCLIGALALSPGTSGEKQDRYHAQDRAKGTTAKALNEFPVKESSALDPVWSIGRAQP